MFWLKLSSSNKNPSEIAYYYINTVLKVGGVPMRMRANRGVENTTVTTNHIKTARFYLENLLQISKLKFCGHTYEKYFYRDGSLIKKT